MIFIVSVSLKLRIWYLELVLFWSIFQNYGLGVEGEGGAFGCSHCLRVWMSEDTRNGRMNLTYACLQYFLLLLLTFFCLWLVSTGLDRPCCCFVSSLVVSLALPLELLFLSGVKIWHLWSIQITTTVMLKLVFLLAMMNIYDTCMEYNTYLYDDMIISKIYKIR